MDRRTFLVGSGKFLGAAALVANTPFIFDVGRNLWRQTPFDPVAFEEECVQIVAEWYKGTGHEFDALHYWLLSQAQKDSYFISMFKEF